MPNVSPDPIYPFVCTKVTGKNSRKHIVMAEDEMDALSQLRSINHIDGIWVWQAERITNYNEHMRLLKAYETLGVKGIVAGFFGDAHGALVDLWRSVSTDDGHMSRMYLWSKGGSLSIGTYMPDPRQVTVEYRLFMRGHSTNVMSKEEFRDYFLSGEHKNILHNYRGITHFLMEAKHDDGQTTKRSV